MAATKSKTEPTLTDIAIAERRHVVDSIRDDFESACSRDDRVTDALASLSNDDRRVSSFDIDAVICWKAKLDVLAQARRAAADAAAGNRTPAELLMRLNEIIESYTHDLTTMPHRHCSTSAASNMIDEAAAHAKSDALRMLNSATRQLRKVV